LGLSDEMRERRPFEPLNNTILAETLVDWRLRDGYKSEAALPCHQNGTKFDPKNGAEVGIKLLINIKN
jgi:hypothetical protein